MQAPQVPPSDEMPFRTTLRTRWSDEDNQNVLNNAVYMTLFEEARHAYFTAPGLLAENQFPFLLAQTHVSFMAPGRGGVPIEVELATTHVGRTSFTQAYRVLGPEGVTWAEAEALLVVVDPLTGRPAPMSEGFRNHVQR
ncbi:MAG: acyl-CoA thioester hydrolase [Chlamydiales bacterium]|jgi:acyl-CoA thioester hydrolase